MDHPADLVFVNGPVFTGDPTLPWARGVAVRGGRIAAVGTGEAVGPHIGPITEVVDLDGRLLCAGFQDAHVHPVTAGLDRLRCNLLETADLDEAKTAIRRYRAEAPGAEWVRGGGWKFDWFPGGLAPVSLLDELVPDRPAYLEVADGHAAWVNTRALELAGVDASTPDPVDGRIERSQDGSPQGTLQEGAMHLVARILPANTVAELDGALMEAQQYLASFGVTSWQDAWVTGEVHDTYRRLAGDGRLRARVRGALWWDRERGIEQIEKLEALRRESVGGYQAGSVKLMLDGVCENFTARMLGPYLDASGEPTTNAGIDFIDPDGLPGIVTELVRRGFQPHFHSLGDRAVRDALDALEAAGREVDHADVRPHLAHIQVVDPDDVPRFSKLGASANAQPLWACDDQTMQVLTVPFLGAARAGNQYPFGDLLRSGAHLAMGSDWAVSTPDVMAQIDVAVTRQVPGDTSSLPFLPDQRLTLEQAFMGFTAGSAYVNFLDDERGTIEPGKVADLVVLEANPFDVGRTVGICVDLTMAAGEAVFER
jgi:predicted amidohydrolase YtcJ